MRARADRQHAWVLASDDRGTHGDYLRGSHVTLNDPVKTLATAGVDSP